MSLLGYFAVCSYSVLLALLTVRYGNQMAFRHCIWFPIFVTALLLPINHEHRVVLWFVCVCVCVCVFACVLSG